MDDVEIEMEKVMKKLNLKMPTPEQMGVSQMEYNHMPDEDIKDLQMRWFEKWVKTLKPNEARKVGAVISMIMVEDKEYRKAMKRDVKKKMKKKMLRR